MYKHYKQATRLNKTTTHLFVQVSEPTAIFPPMCMFLSRSRSIVKNHYSYIKTHQKYVSSKLRGPNKKINSVLSELPDVEVTSL